MHSRFRGALLGLAAADALGTTLEFTEPGTHDLADMVGGGPFRLKPGEWTDDTSMALCLAESLLACKGFDARDQMQRYVDWRQNGHLSSIGWCFDIGTTTGRALDSFVETGEPYSGSTNPFAAGNGSIMRLAPVPMFYARDAAEAVRRSAESSRTTHASSEAVDACRYFGGLVWGGLNGIPKAELLAPAYSPVLGLWEREPLAHAIAAVAAGSFWHKQPPEIRGTGYVVQSLEAALWALARSDDYRTGALLAANLGEDADTTAAVYGQLAGAIYGEEGIPSPWRSLLAERDTIEQLADGLYRLATA
jgi:ADP-ribosyl-[dinitrogen reductase] hydrolase